jgi:GNAT superfamily N-acetyltransferase
MTEADIEAVSAVRVRGWQAAYAGIVPQSYLDGMTVEADARQRAEQFRRSGSGASNLVADDDRTGVVGWACLGSYRGAEVGPGSGELYALYVRPDLIGTGIGSALISAVHSHAADRGFDTMKLWVLRDNLRARRFYESTGYTFDGVAQEGDTDRDMLPKMRYHRTLL